MADIKVRDLADTTNINLQNQIMVLTNDEQNTVQNVTVENLLTNVVSPKSANGLVISDDKKLYVDNSNTGVTAGIYPYPSSVTVNSKGKITNIVAGAQGDVPVATPTTLGVVKPDNDTILIDANGVLTTSLKTRVTNCAIEIPHRVNYTCSGGTITIKAGSVLIVPYGTTDLSSTITVGSSFIHANFKVVDTQYRAQASGISPNANTFFVWAEVQNDIVITPSSSTSRICYINLTGNTVRLIRQNSSSNSAPSITTMHYNTTTNLVQYYNAGTLQDAVYSLPIFNVYEDSTTLKAVEGVYDGVYRIGGTVFVDKGIKILSANGYNDDGTINNAVLETSVLTLITTASTGDFKVFLRLNTGTAIPRLYISSSGSYLGELTAEPVLNTTGFQYYFNTNQMIWYMHNANETTWTAVPHYNIAPTISFGDNVYENINIYPAFNSNNYLLKTGGKISAQQASGGQGVLTIESNQWGSLLIKNTNITNGSVVSTAAGQYMGIDYRDSNNARVGFFGVVQPKNNDTPYVEIQSSNDGGFNFPKCTTKATTTSSAANNRVGVLIENYVNGASWYRVWSDGWIEQGGVATNYESDARYVTVTFLKPFSDTNYTVVNSGVWDGMSNDACWWVGSKTTTGVRLSSNRASTPENWYACGY